MSVRDLYDALAPGYDALVASSGYVGPRWLDARLGELAEPPGCVLDLGCASGALGRLVRRRFARARLVGIDISPAMIERAREQGGYDALFVHDLDRPLPAIADAGADLALAIGCIEFIADPGRFLAEVARMLAPGGTLLASFQEYRPERPALAPRTIYSAAVAHRAHRADEVRELMAAAGLAIESLESATGYVTGSGFACPYLMLRATRLSRQAM